MRTSTYVCFGLIALPYLLNSLAEAQDAVKNMPSVKNVGAAKPYDADEPAVDDDEYYYLTVKNMPAVKNVAGEPEKAYTGVAKAHDAVVAKSHDEDSRRHKWRTTRRPNKWSTTPKRRTRRTTTRSRTTRSTTPKWRTTRSTTRSRTTRSTTPKWRTTRSTTRSRTTRSTTPKWKTTRSTTRSHSTRSTTPIRTTYKMTTNTPTTRSTTPIRTTYKITTNTPTTSSTTPISTTYTTTTVTPVITTVTPCVNRTKADIYFVLDASSSIGDTNWLEQTKFAAEITQAFRVAPDDIQFAVMTFNNQPQTIFDLNTYSDNLSIYNKIREIQYPLGQGTYTDRALRAIRENGLFTPAFGGRNDAEKILIVMTDGMSTDRTKTLEEASLLKAQGVKSIAVGVGNQFDLSELQGIASDSTKVFTTDSFEMLDVIKNELIETTCNEL